jgi:hypothetical protein
MHNLFLVYVWYMYEHDKFAFLQIHVRMYVCYIFGMSVRMYMYLYGCV